MDPSETTTNPRPSSLAYRALDDGRELVVYPLTFGRARLIVGRQGRDDYDDAW